MVIKYIGKIDFDVQDVTKKHISQSSWKKVAMIKTDCDLYKYYAWFISKRFNLTLNKVLRGTHITFINDKCFNHELFEQLKEKYHNKEITFYIEIEPYTNGEHWWLRAYSPEAETIREELGLHKYPYFGLHLTLGYANEKNIKHSEYIHQFSKEFNILENAERIHLDDHEIIEFTLRENNK